MFNILVVVFLCLRSYIFPSLQELRSVSYRRALLFLHPKVNIFSLTYKTFFKKYYCIKIRANPDIGLALLFCLLSEVDSLPVFKLLKFLFPELGSLNRL